MGGSAGGLSSLAGGSAGGLSSLAGGVAGGLLSLVGGVAGGLSSLAGGFAGGVAGTREVVFYIALVCGVLLKRVAFLQEAAWGCAVLE